MGPGKEAEQPKPVSHRAQRARFLLVSLLARRPRIWRPCSMHTPGIFAMRNATDLLGERTPSKEPIFAGQIGPSGPFARGRYTESLRRRIKSRLQVGSTWAAAALFIVLISSAVGPVALSLGAEPERPDFLIVVTDDQRWDALGFQGNPLVNTPNMDRLARQGVFFDNAFVTTSICAASRASIFLGQFEGTHGYTFGQPALSVEAMQNSYPALLRKAGYRTGFVGKYGIATAAGSQKSMFDVFTPLSRNPYMKQQPDGSQRHLTRLTGDKAEEFLRSCPADTPFCLSISFNAPHAEDGDPRQYIYDPAYAGLYNDRAVPVPELADERYFALLPEFLKDPDHSTSRHRWLWRFDSPEKFQTMVKGYYRMITGVDEQVGRLRAELRRLGRADRTVIVFLSDNGYFLGERGLAGKWLMYERSIRIPMAIYDPRAAEDRQSRRVEPVVLNIDVAPTVIDMAGLEIPESMQGRSLVPLLEGASPAWREDFFYEHHFNHRGKIPRCEGIRGKRWKYVRYTQQQPVYEQLFDLRNDPKETSNLTSDPEHRAVLDSLRNQTDRWRKRVGTPPKP